MSKIGYRGSIEERFWKYVHKDEKDKCWNWIGAKMSRGYGHLVYKGKLIASHRYSFELHHGAISPGLFILHKCDNVACVNPNHLYAGTQKENIRDAITRGRLKMGTGDNCQISKIKENDRITIGKMIINGARVCDLIKIYPVCRRTIHRIKHKLLEH